MKPKIKLKPTPSQPRPSKTHAGRPRTFKHGVHVRLSGELIDYVHRTAKEYGLSRSEFISNCIRLYSPYAIFPKNSENSENFRDNKPDFVAAAFAFSDNET
jgi:hypothetical protein